MAAYSSKLQCVYLAWRAIDQGELALDLPPDNACDMRGAIEIAGHIEPTVWRIEVYVGGILDVLYLQPPGAKQWQCFDGRSAQKKGYTGG